MFKGFAIKSCFLRAWSFLTPGASFEQVEFPGSRDAPC